MKKLPCYGIFGQAFVHESEELDKVKKAMSVIFPQKLMSEETVSGLAGTSIKIIRAELRRKNAKIALEKILSMLSQSDKMQILKELKLRISEEGKLYLRFDKQKAYLTSQLVLVPEEEDSIQVVIYLEAYPANIVNFVNAAKQIFE